MAYTDIFKRRSMLAMLDQALPIHTFFVDTFFRNVSTKTTEVVDIDIRKGKRRLAPFVNPLHEGKPVSREGYRTDTYKPPYIKPKMVTTAQDVLNKAAGQNLFTPVSGSILAARQLGMDFADLRGQIARRVEWMAAQVLTSGQLHVVGDGVNDVITFGMESSHLPALSGTSMWTDYTNARPIDDLRTWADQVAQDSGMYPNDAVFGREAMNNFLKCAQVKESGGLFDNRKIKIGQIDAKMISSMGVIYYGTIDELGLDLWVYNNWYQPDYNEEPAQIQPYMPTNKVLLGSRDARTDLVYAAIQDLDGLAAMKEFPKSWTTDDPSQRWVMLQSAPLTIPTQVDAFLCATVHA